MVLILSQICINDIIFVDNLLYFISLFSLLVYSNELSSLTITILAFSILFSLI